MPKDKTIPAKKYLYNVKPTNKEFTKKEVLEDLVNRSYARNETESIIDKITPGGC